MNTILDQWVRMYPFLITRPIIRLIKPLINNNSIYSFLFRVCLLALSPLVLLDMFLSCCFIVCFMPIYAGYYFLFKPKEFTDFFNGIYHD